MRGRYIGRCIEFYRQLDQAYTVTVTGFCNDKRSAHEMTTIQAFAARRYVFDTTITCIIRHV